MTVLTVAGRVVWAVVCGVARELWFWLTGFARLVHSYTLATILVCVWLVVTAWQAWWQLLAPVAIPVVALALWWRLGPVSFALVVSRPLDRALIRRWVRRRWGSIMADCGLGRRTYPTMNAPAETTVPRLRRLRWDRGQLVARPELLAGQTVEDVEEAADRLRVTVKANRIKIIPNPAVTECSIAWGFGDPLETPVRVTVPPPDAPVGSLDLITLGVTEDGGPWRFGLKVPCLGGGMSDAGKSGVMQGQLIALGPAIKAGIVRAAGIDLKGGNELAFSKRMLTWYARRPDEAVALLEQLVDALEARLARQEGVTRQHTPTVEEPLVVLFIDELAALTAYQTDRDLIRRAEVALSRILTAGRAAGYIAHGFLQDPRKETVKFRHFFRQGIGLRLREREEVAMVLTDGAVAAGALCHRIPRSMPGVAYVLSDADSRPVRVRAFKVTDDDIRLAAERFPAPRQLPITGRPAIEAQSKPGGARTRRSRTTELHPQPATEDGQELAS